jgi:membrane protein
MLQPEGSFVFSVFSHTFLDELQLRLGMPRLISGRPPPMAIWPIFQKRATSSLRASNKGVQAYVVRKISFRRPSFQMNGSQPLWLQAALLCRRVAASFAQIIGEVVQRYGRIDGEQCAASFAYYAFFSLFPLILLLVVVGTFLVPDRLLAARQVVQQVEEYVPLQAKDKAVLVDTIDHAIQNGWRAGIFGILALIWSALRFFQALVIGVNRAWGFKDYNWWKLPLKNLFMIGILISALLFGLLAPLIFNRIKAMFSLDLTMFVGLAPMILPPAILFYGLLMFYKFAPRRSARFSQVWIAALLATLFLEMGQNIFEWYLVSFTSFNALYGVFGTIMGLLLWIYFSGVILLLGGCVAATIYSPRDVEKAGDSIPARIDRRSKSNR